MTDAKAQTELAALIRGAAVLVPHTTRGFERALASPDANWLARQDFQCLMAALNVASRNPDLVAALNNVAHANMLMKDVENEDPSSPPAA